MAGTTTAGSSGRVSSSGSDARTGAPAFVELFRPLNGVISLVAVLVGAFVSRSPTWWWPALLGGLATFAAAAGANAVNDGLDVEIDRVNRPGRPVPSGRVTPRQAFVTAGVAYAVSLVLAAAVGPRAAVLAASCIAVTVVYSRVLKGVPVVGNIAVALVAAAPFLMGGFTQDRYLLALVPTALAFLLHLAREIVKDVEDAAGDAASRVRTLAVRRGPGPALALARGVLIVLIGLAALPFALGVYGWGYAAVVVVMDVMIVRLMRTMAGNIGRSGSARPSNALKAVMALGLVAFVAGVLWRAPGRLG